MISMQVENTVLTVDPLDHYKNDQACAEACGILIEWLQEIALMDLQAPSEGLAEFYQYFDGWKCNEAMVKDEKFTYPGDEPMAPLLRVVRGDEALFIYPHSIVATVKNFTTRWTRMD